MVLKTDDTELDCLLVLLCTSVYVVNTLSHMCLLTGARYRLERDIFGTVAQNKSMFFAISSITNIV